MVSRTTVTGNPLPRDDRVPHLQLNVPFLCDIACLLFQTTPYNLERVDEISFTME
jgi:hypothetical protein